MAESEKPDFISLWQRYQNLDKGQKAELRRLQQPDDLTELPAFYALFSGKRPSKQHQRIAYLLSVCSHKEGSKSVGAQLAEKNISEMRLTQVIRSEYPNDLIQFRRICQHAELTTDWNHLGDTLWYWGDDAKRKILEDYFVTRYAGKTTGGQ